MYPFLSHDASTLLLHNRLLVRSKLYSDPSTLKTLLKPPVGPGINSLKQLNQSASPISSQSATCHFFPVFYSWQPFVIYRVKPSQSKRTAGSTVDRLLPPFTFPNSLWRSHATETCACYQFQQLRWITPANKRATAQPKTHTAIPIHPILYFILVDISIMCCWRRLVFVT